GTSRLHNTTRADGALFSPTVANTIASGFGCTLRARASLNQVANMGRGSAGSGSGSSSSAGMIFVCSASRGSAHGSVQGCDYASARAAVSRQLAARARRLVKGVRKPRCAGFPKAPMNLQELRERLTELDGQLL